MHSIRRIITGSRTSWIVLVLFAIGAGVLLSLNTSEAQTAPATGLPASAESARVAELREQLPSADTTSALVVFEREGDELTDADLTAIEERAADLTDLSSADRLPPATVADDG